MIAKIASELADQCYESAMGRMNTPLSNATNAYIEALREKAMVIETSGKYPDVDVTQFMRDFHSQIG